VQGETSTGSPCANFCAAKRGGATKCRPSLHCLLGRFLRSLGSGWRGFLGLLFGSELLLHLEGDGIGVHLIHTRRIPKNRGGIRPRGRQQDACFHQQTGECAFVGAADVSGKSLAPARKLKVPAQLRATDTTTLTWDQLRLALSKLSLRDRILLELDMTNALRPSELFAFRWKRFDYRASTLTVAETAYKGKIRDWGKTKKSLTVIHIPRQLADDLQAWRLECEEKAREAFSKGKRKSASLSPDVFIFENEDGGFLDTDNYRKRVLHKIARELHLPKLTFQVIRRTIATLAQKKGTIKDVQGVMRHSRTATTTDVYMQEIPASVQSTINSINSELRKSDAKTRKKSKESAPAGTVVSSRRKPSARVTQNDTKSWKGGSAPLPAYA
jgi:integrase